MLDCDPYIGSAPADSWLSTPLRPDARHPQGGSHSVLSAVFEASIDGIMTFRPVWGLDGQVVDFAWTALSPATAKLTEHAPAELLGKGMRELWPHDEVHEMFQSYLEVLNTGIPLATEVMVPRLDGGHGWFHINCVRHSDGDDDGLVVICRNVTEYRRNVELLDKIRGQHRTLERQALQDPLTGLANRLLLDTHLEHAINRLPRQDTSLAVMFLDLDRLKWVNDTHGHRVGDALLVELGTRLTSSARPYDTIARIGGDEFVVICEDVPNSDIPRIAHRLFDVCTRPFELDGLHFAVPASLGVAVAKGDERDADDLVADADAAMYRAKAAGGNRIEFADGVDGAVFEIRYVIETGFAAALAGNEFDILCEPIVRAHDLSMVAADVRVLWDHPELGRISHDDMVAASRPGRLTGQLHTWMLERAIDELARHRDARQNRSDERSVVLVVDVDGDLVGSDSFVEWLSDALASHDVPAASLCIGLDEAFLTGHVGSAIATVDALTELGVLIERVGVGVRSSPAQYVQSYPMRYARIAPALIAAVGSGGEDVIAAIVDIAHSRGRMLVASGVDTAEQFDALRRLGVDLLQGKHLAEALTADQLVQMARDDPN